MLPTVLDLAAAGGIDLASASDMVTDAQSALGLGVEGLIRDFVLIGKLSKLPQCKEVFPALEKLYDIRFHTPKYSEYCTAIGAALYYTIKEQK